MHLHLPNQQTLALDRPIIMGILNVTPDSFSDGGEFVDQASAVAHGLAMAKQGAQIIDVGGESTRPGAKRVPASQQIQRVARVIGQLRQALDQTHPQVLISVDTTLAPVAQAALDAGAVILNDVSAGQDDLAMFDLAAKTHASLVLMHMQGSPATMQQNPHYQDVVQEVKTFLIERASAAIAAGVRPQQIVIDPGIGFGKSTDHNLTLLANLDQLTQLGYPALLGASRKRFLSQIAQDSDTQPPQTHNLTGATCAATALGVVAGVSIFRVHDVQPNRHAADLAWSITQAAKHS